MRQRNSLVKKNLQTSIRHFSYFISFLNPINTLYKQKYIINNYAIFDFIEIIRVNKSVYQHVRPSLWMAFIYYECLFIIYMLKYAQNVVVTTKFIGSICSFSASLHTRHRFFMILPSPLPSLSMIAVVHQVAYRAAIIYWIKNKHNHMSGEPMSHRPFPYKLHTQEIYFVQICIIYKIKVFYIHEAIYSFNQYNN